MSLAAQVRLSVDARIQSQEGLTTTLDFRQADFSVDVGDCTKTYGERRTFGSTGFDEIEFAGRLAVVKFLMVKNLSKKNPIGLSAGWNGSQFSIFRSDATAWNFSPMVNLGSLTLRGYPVWPLGAWISSSANAPGFGTTVGGSILRIGGVAGERYEFFAMGT